MMLPRPLSNFKAIRKPGKGGPAVFAFGNPGPPLRDFTKNIRLKNKTLCPDKPWLGSQAEGLRNRCLRSQPRRIGPGSAHWARHQHAGPYPTTLVTKLHKGNRFFWQVVR